MSYDTNNVFAKILRNEIPAKKVFENEFALAFHDLHPSAPVHVLVIPKGEFTSFHDFSVNADPNLLIGYFKAVREVACLVGVAETGYRLIANHGSDANQSVPHFHMHIIGKKRCGPLVVGDTHHQNH